VARRTLAASVETFEREGFGVTATGDFERRLERDGGPAVRLGMTSAGRIFGGHWALEIANADPVLPRTGGLRGRPRGSVRLRGVAFRPRGGDAEGVRLAHRLEQDEALQRSLALVHFERIRVEPDGRAVIRHMGGSVVWILFPPFVRCVPLVPEQARAAVEALEAFARAAR
jgi:Protein of unknown function (DUF3156)